jgi:hypothetical protein
MLTQTLPSFVSGEARKPPEIKRRRSMGLV